MLWKILLRVTATRLRAAILQDLATILIVLRTCNTE